MAIRFDIKKYEKSTNMAFPTKKPQYGYARDRYGRVQERDRFTDGAYHVEDYGQSSYDPEDDNGD